jgi:trehalose 6-phosphate synthase/phosphatase
MAIPSNETLEALDKLTNDPKNLVYVISGRDQNFLEYHFGHFKNLGMSAEHGGFIREAGSNRWTNFTESLDMDWMSEVEEIFKYYTEVSSSHRHSRVWRLTYLDSIAHRWQPYRDEKEFNYMALPSQRPRVGVGFPST